MTLNNKISIYIKENAYLNVLMVLLHIRELVLLVVLIANFVQAQLIIVQVVIKIYI